MSDPPEVTSAPPTATEAPRVLPMLLGFAVIFYLFGGASAEFGWYPYRQLVKPAYSAVSALQKRLALTESRRETDLWRVPTYERRGVVKHDPDLAIAHNNLAVHYTELDVHLDDALAHAKTAVQLAPIEANYFDTLAWVYFKKQMFAEAQTAIKKAIELDPTEVMYRQRLNQIQAAKK